MFGFPIPLFALYACLVLGLSGLALWLEPLWLWALGPFLLSLPVGLYDLYSRHNVLRNYPLVGHIRYLMEFIRPELRQYLFESEQSGRPYNREQRTVIYERAYGLPDTSPFGTIRDVEAAGADFAEHSLAVKTPPASAGRHRIGGEQCAKPYDASRLNISAMSFGSLSSNAVLAMNKGAHMGGFAHNTGEGGISEYHLAHGADLIWEIGTGYFGCRTREGRFDGGAFEAKAAGDTVRMIELKLSQGAKPSHGGVLPANKVTEEIARVREIDPWTTCVSPPAHPEFDTPAGLLEFVARLRDLSGGKPTGFKLCLGRKSEFMAICKAMRETGIRPDFITVDGAEGGTGAAPVEFSDSLGTYINEGINFVHNALVGAGLRDDIRLLASGKVAMGFDMLVKCALGADGCNAARPFMFAVGCIQSRRCHTGTCPTGVATQSPQRMRALDVQGKAIRVHNYHRLTLQSFLDLTGALGIAHPDELTPDLIYHRPEFGPARTYAELYPATPPGGLLDGDAPDEALRHWRQASADRF
ncbi:glutamate synthase [Salinisphaera sp. PC39]|uniref:FMN-binding glutamate synthase family protein n=1 Tax=Salinisphaera sp. PC39 TaxID=1304156 RepID=UPI00333F1EA2